MKSYIKVFKGCRGEVENVEVVSSELSVREFCDELYKELVEKLMEEVEGVESEEEINEYLGEFGGVSEYDGMWEVGVSEEEWIEVYEVVK
jgi:ethanolamine utilization protein EutQ (cupin superfamily)